MLKNFTITAKLGILTAVMLTALLALGGASHFGINKISESIDEIGRVRVPSILGLLGISEGQTAVKASVMSAAMYENSPNASARFTNILEQRRSAWERIEAGWRLFEPLPQTAEEAVLWEQFQAEWAAWKEAEQKAAHTLAALASNADPEQQKSLFVSFYQHMSAADPLFLKSEATLERIVQLNGRIATDSVDVADAGAVRARMIMVIVSVVSAAAAIACAFSIIRSIVLPLNRALRVASTVASGDLTSVIEESGKDETSRLLAALNDMNHGLVGIVERVRVGTETIASASKQLATGNQDLSARTEEQASSLEETASSIEELTATVKQNAENARLAGTLALQATQVANKGDCVIAGVVDTMGSISQYSGKIADITGVIDSIAFQTNILALNAAVEAARAGEQGRGFAVVASEVRSLAHRSATAATEIKALIAESVGKVESGVRQVSDARSSMVEVVDSIRDVTRVVSEISVASVEQAAGIEQINSAVLQMDLMTQQNAALVEEASAASESMRGQALQLAQVVSTFKLTENETDRGLPIRLRAGDSRSL